MADQPPDNKPSTPSRSTISDEGSIINRKIERRGLPSSFSSNLVHPRVSPPRQREGAASSGKSVKSIVNFFEASKSNTTSATSGDGESAKSKPASGSESRVISSTTATTPTSQKALVQQQQSLANAPDVEKYSLTLLKYRQYFTDQPLARCLDGQNHGTQTENKPSSLDGEKHTISPSSLAEQQLHVPKKRQAVADNSQTKKLSTGNVSNNVANLDSPKGLVHRNPQQVAAFWNHIRNYLWISDEELVESREHNHKETIAPESGSIKTDVQSCNTFIPSPSLPPPTPLYSSHRSDSNASQRSLDEQRRRLASSEKHISELEAYVGKKHRDGVDSSSPSSPASTLRSPLASPTLATDGAYLRAHSNPSREPPRCTSCSKICASYSSSSRRQSGQSRDGPPPPRPPMDLSRGNAGRVKEPPVLDERDQEWNFF